ncbi:MAG: hypothetical protein ACJATT_004386 [Myxococcota bacterium]|jgi:hypothetical protein
MADRVDDLFASGTRRGPRLTLPYILIVTGTIVALVGLLCTSAPGGVMVLVGLMRVETERKRVESGALPASDTEAVTNALRVAYAAMGLVVVMFIVQTLLLCLGYYQQLWGQLFYTLRELIGVG